MRIHRLRVTDFAAIREADIEFGPGLNVLYGPNDLGKSTLADAIRLALLLPHTSTIIEPYVPWTGGQDPVVELTFETEPQRIWRVRKEFGKGGSSLLAGIEERPGLRRRRAGAKGGRKTARDSALGHSRTRRRRRQQGSADELPRDRASVDAGGRDRHAPR